MTLAENPRAIIGHNQPPPDAASGVTVEEARMVMRAIKYVQDYWPIKSILIKHSKKHKLEMALRIAVASALKGEVRLESLRILLQLNRKTCSENQQRPEIWAEYDPEFDAHMENFREVLYRHGRLDHEAMSERLLHWIEADPILRDLEKEEKAKQKILAKQREADDWEAARARLEQIAVMKTVLISGGVAEAEKIAAKHAGPEHLAKTLSDEALSVLDRIVKKDDKGKRETASYYDDGGLAECMRLGLARDAEPWRPKGAPAPSDPVVGPTDLAKRVFVKAVAIKRIVVKPAKSGKSGKKTLPISVVIG